MMNQCDSGRGAAMKRTFGCSSAHSRTACLVIATILAAACSRHDHRIQQHKEKLASLGATTAAIGGAWLAVYPGLASSLRLGTRSTVTMKDVARNSSFSSLFGQKAMRTRLMLPLALGTCLVSIGTASADPIRLDQSAVGPPPTLGRQGVVIGGCCDLASQTFTAGITADLVALSVDIAATEVVPLHLAVTALSGPPLPDLSQVLAEVIVPSGSSSLDSVILLPQPFRQIRGTSYAIVASYPTAPPPPKGLFTAIWSRTVGDVYPGELISRLQDGTFVLQLGGDARFKTFVNEPVPEPATIVLLGGGVAVIALKRRANLFRR